MIIRPRGGGGAGNPAGQSVQTQLSSIREDLRIQSPRLSLANIRLSRSPLNWYDVRARRSRYTTS